MTKNKVYFAGPLFSQAERNYNQRLCSRIEELGYDVFLPQRDGAEMDSPAYADMTPSERAQVIFDIDMEQIRDCEIFLFVLDGRVPDEGACFELGVAYQQSIQGQPHKRILGLHTDMRASFIGSKLNAMVAEAFDRIVTSEKELITLLS